IGDRGVNKNEIEYTSRRTGETENWPLDEVNSRLAEKLQLA
ncbi:uncharacterized protein METZ01_LOCUS377076, partial [marine metagenome]